MLVVAFADGVGEDLRWGMVISLVPRLSVLCPWCDEVDRYVGLPDGNSVRLKAGGVGLNVSEIHPVSTNVRILRWRR